MNVVLTEVEPFAEYTDGTVFYRSCELCHETAVVDIWAGLDEASWRTFYRVADGDFDVCEHCLPVLFAEAGLPAADARGEG